MEKVEYMFTELYRQDLDKLMSFLVERFMVNESYYNTLTKHFPLDLTGYIDFSLKLGAKTSVRFFLVYYEAGAQEWIKANIESIIDKTAPQAKDKIMWLKALFDKDDSNYYLTYGADITMPYLKVYIVSNKIVDNLRTIAKVFDFNHLEGLKNLNMMGLNIYEDSIATKLYLIYNFPDDAAISQYYPALDKLPRWSKKELSRIETFMVVLPKLERHIGQKGIKISLAMPTLFNPKVKSRLKSMPETRGLFLQENIYPSWVSFNNRAEIETIYFKPKRDYVLEGKDKDINFKDKVYDDYRQEGMI
jgi:hypothetical protein